MSIIMVCGGVEFRSKFLYTLFIKINIFYVYTNNWKEI